MTRITDKIHFMKATALPEEAERYRLVLGDVLITKDSETWNDIGVPSLVEYATPDLVSGYHLALLRPRLDSLLGSFLHRALRARPVTYQFHVSANGVTRYGLPHGAIKSLTLPIPPIEEQQAIGRFIDHADRALPDGAGCSKATRHGSERTPRFWPRTCSDTHYQLCNRFAWAWKVASFTDYLWRRVLTREGLTDILENYAQVVETKDERTGRKKAVQIWPRYHQLDVVRRLLADARQRGAGQRYLIQHSAGSGKSNSIAWLAHQLITLRRDEAPAFDSIIVVTDRRILDKQIRDTIRQFAQVGATVGHAEHSGDLRTFIESGKKIFGRPLPPVDGKVRHEPFHSYTMKQAIQEGFILDVLKHYTPIDSHYRLVKTVESDPEFDTRARQRSSGGTSRATITPYA